MPDCCISIAFDLTLAFCHQCYFLTSASPSTPIVYNVERVRQGRSYVTRSVKAIQNGHTIFVMMCSFQRPEPWQPSYQWEMPTVPPPEDCELEESRYTRMIQSERPSPMVKEYFQDYLTVGSQTVNQVELMTYHSNRNGLAAPSQSKPQRSMTCYRTAGCDTCIGCRHGLYLSMKPLSKRYTTNQSP